jgi:hypothetical protein
MGLDPLAIATTAATVGSQVYNTASTGRTNLKQRQFAEEQMFRQREWALQDWNMQNEYNAPVNVRKRMIDAGMNPALMYGSGGSGGISGPVRSTPSAEWRPQAPQIDTGGLSGIYTIMKTIAATNLLDAQTRNNNAQAFTREHYNEGLKRYADPASGLADYDNYYTDKMAMELRQAGQNFLNSIDENQRRELYSAKNAQQVAERIALMQAQKATTEAQRDQIMQNIDNLKKSGQLKQFEIDGNEILNKQFSGPAAQVLFGLLKRFGIVR